MVLRLLLLLLVLFLHAAVLGLALVLGVVFDAVFCWRCPFGFLAICVVVIGVDIVSLGVVFVVILCS